MHYKVVDKFGPDSGEAWDKYVSWRGLSLSKFDSVDGILRGDMFTPESEDDWSNCYAEKYLPPLISNLEFARLVHQRYPSSDLVGVEINVDRSYQEEDKFLGYEVIDSSWDVSMLTNWGTDEEGLFSHHIESNGLIASLTTALDVRNKLRELFPEDGHACECSVWAIYAIAT